MHICQIEIDNFKSFASKTVIPFRTGFTTISGPNGSGKSNIIDSILFCLGLSTSRTMRAEKISDLINNMSKRKEASVTITFQKDSDELDEAAKNKQLDLVDGEKQTKPKANDDDEEETEEEQFDLGTGEFVQVTRRIKKGSQGYNSTYYMNGRTTTLTEIHDYLSQYRVSPGMYNVMMQGDVQGIVNMSPMERRKIIDEIAGVAEFDRKIEQAQRELEATGANIERNTILLNEIVIRMEQLATERDHALKYKKLRDEKIELEGIQLSAEYWDVKKAVDTANQNIADARKNKEARQKNLKDLKKTLDDTREELRELSNEVKRKGEDQQIALRKQIESLKGHIGRKTDTIDFNTDKIKENEERLESMANDIKRQQENIKDIDAEIEQFQHQLKELQGLYNQEAKAYETLNKEFDVLTGSGSELTTKRNEIRALIAEAEDHVSEINRKQLDIEAEVKRFQYEIDLKLRGQTEYLQKSEKLTSSQSTLKDDIDFLTKEKEAFEAQVKKLQLDYSDTRVKLNKVAGEYNETNRQYLQMEAKKRAYEDVNFHRSVETVLNSDLKGVHGTLAQLGNVDKEYALAMEIAIGGRVQNIVVDDDSVARDGIEMLKNKKAGRATFLPLNKIRPFKDLPNLPSNKGVVDFAFNLMDCAVTYDDAFYYALGDTLIVEDLESARPLLRKYRMVTLDGSLLEKSGAMTGGSQAGRGNGFFAGAGLEEELEALYQKLSKTEQEKDTLEKTLTSIELKMEGVKDDYTALMSQYSQKSAELAAVENQLNEIKETHVQGEDVSDIEKQIKELENEKTKLNEAAEHRQKELTTLNENLENVEKQLPSDKMEQLREQMNEVKFQMDYYDSQLRNAQADIKGKEMEKNYQDVGIKDTEKRIEDTKTQNTEMAKEITEAKEEIELTEKQIAELEAQTSEIDEELKKLQEQRDEVQARLIEEEKQKSIFEREIEQLEEQILSFQARKRELAYQREELARQLAEADIDAEAIDGEALPSAEEVQKKLQSLTKRMEAMEPVNMLAIDEYDKVQVRHDELAEKIQTLETETETINIKISGYHELKLAAFMKAYESVDSHFKTIFAELSDGIGHLSLTNKEEPFNGGLAIYAQPRGKKVQRIEAMSGGEKSLTSLAFVFSLQRYMPAPFYALDEVDMNLDGINAEKLAVMVKREAESAQFVVVSLRKPMLEHSDRTLGVTQRKNGITKVTGIKIRNDEEETLNGDMVPDEVDPNSVAENDVKEAS